MLGPIWKGLAVAAAGLALAMMVAGAGHGWVTPFFFSPILFLLYPVVFIRLQAPEKLPWRAIDLLVPAAAIALDLWLVKATRDEGLEYFHGAMATPPLPHLWIAVWLGWQGVALWLLVGEETSGG